MSKLKTFTELNLVRRNIIMLENNLLEFDITGILGSEINQHIDFSMMKLRKPIPQ